MTGKTGIEWTDRSWNPISGCTRVVLGNEQDRKPGGCDHCYAFTLHDMRHAAYLKYGGVYPKTGKPMPKQYAQPFTIVQLLSERLEDPLHVRQHQRFFVNSMSDLFHRDVPDSYIKQIFEVMKRADWHVFQILTKRAGRLRRLGRELDWPSNVWIGVSIEKDELTHRADALREIPAAVKFLSCEPLLGPLPSLELEGLDWIIVGGESGPEARPMEEAWVLDLRNRCVAAQTPFFFKQWGGRTPKAGGRLLQGQRWNEFPHSYQALSSKEGTDAR